jgi:YjbE family integral membrane protein
VELFSAEFFSALAAIIVIDLALAGDNAIVIALAARNLPGSLQRKAILWGTVGAIAVRVVMTLAVVWLLGIPGLMAAGGAILVWIACKLLKPQEGESHEVKAAATFWGAMQTIVIADAAMGLDNVLAVAGAAHGSFLLVVIGLVVSIPIVVWGSTFILRWVARYPWIVQVGVAVLAWTAGKMIVSEPLVAPFFQGHEAAAPALYALVFAIVFGYGHLARARAREKLHVLPDPVSVTPERRPAMRRILVPVDGSQQSLAAVRAAIAEGRDHVERIDLVNVQPLLNRHVARFVAWRERQGWRDERSARAFENARRLVETAGIACHTHAVAGPLGPSIADEARRTGAHEIVMAATRRGALGQFFRNSVSARLLETSRVPVRVVPTGPASILERVAIPVGIGMALIAIAADD